jgi:peptide deformylase
MKLHVVQWPSDKLRLVSKPVEVLADVKDLIVDMQDTLKALKGLGLAAVQVGIPVRLIVTDFPEMPVLINPVVTGMGFRKKIREGCLSLPGFFEEVLRSEAALVTYVDAAGVDKKLVVEGVAAQCLLHEAEHLAGHFFLEHVSSARRDAIRVQLRRRKQ